MPVTPIPHEDFPYCPDTERAILSVLLQEPQRILARTREGGGYRLFHQREHQTLYEVMAAFEATPTKTLKVRDLLAQLKSQELLERAGGKTYVEKLAATKVDLKQVDRWFGVLRDFLVRREFLQVCWDSQVAVQDASKSLMRLLQETSERLYEFQADLSEGKPSTIRDQVFNFLQVVEETYVGEKPEKALSTGYKGWDTLTYGLHPGEVMMIASEPAIGKTALAMSLAQNIALPAIDAMPVGYVAVEDPSTHVVERLMAAISGVSTDKVRTGMLSQVQDFPRLTRAAKVLAECELHIEDRAALSLADLRNVAIQWKRSSDIRLLIVDDCQALRKMGSESAVSNEEIVQGLKTIARELDLPVVGFLGFGRTIGEGTQNGQSNASNSRIDAALKFADSAAWLTRVEAGEKDKGKDKFKRAALHVIRQRRGLPGVLNFAFDPERLRMEDEAIMKDPSKRESTLDQWAANDVCEDDLFMSS